MIINKLDKIVVNVGTGRLSAMPGFEDKMLPEIIKDISAITGQKPETRPAKKSIAGFKLRQGTIVGLKTTLRGKRMEDFLVRLLRIVLPRVRDFRGIDLKSVDQNGNLTIGIKEHLVFPEIFAETSKTNFGIEATIVPKLRIRNHEKAVEFYRTLGVPFKK
ncbi:MAG: 50S ribosomal protein L5 [Candidatus Pacebacteria bacterium]|nr:50S ribosomal protein L5 [Candidatus Paceibacterota bacterium]